MNVLFLMISFPDVRENSNLYSDLAEEFRKNGLNIYVATLLEKKYNQSTYLEEVKGLKNGLPEKKRGPQNELKDGLPEKKLEETPKEAKPVEKKEEKKENTEEDREGGESKT